MTQNGGARCIVARVTGEAHRALLAWRNAVDLQIIQAQLDRSGRALVIWFGETHGFAQITALPRPGEARPHYGSFGGGYEYCFLHGPAGWMLQVENYAQGSVRFGLATPIPPLLLDDPTAVRVDALPTPPEGVSWSYPRGLMDDRDRAVADRAMFSIDGEMYDRLVAWDWTPARLAEYRYYFVPLSVGCEIAVEHGASGARIHLTQDVGW